MLNGAIGTVQSRIDVHCIPITLAKRKKHRPHLTERVRAPVSIGFLRERALRSFAFTARDAASMRQHTGIFRLRANPYDCWLFAHSIITRESAITRPKTVVHRVRFAANADAVSNQPPLKFFLHRHACAHRFKERDRAKRANRVLGDSLAHVIRMPSPASERTSQSIR
jgi:hypothetical protein